MFGPQPKGFWTDRLEPSHKQFRHLLAGGWYTVIKGFWDYDGVGHAEMETWSFQGYSFLPYDDGLSLFVSFDGEHEWHIRMQCTEDRQGPIVDSLADYVVPTSSPQVAKAACGVGSKPIVRREWRWWPDEFGGPARTMTIGANAVHWHMDADDDFKQASSDTEQSIEDFLTKGPAWTAPDEIAESMALHFGLRADPKR
jgi:hypothetical protein